MSQTPDLDELVGTDLSASERERLRRAHDLLIAAGPPPALTPALERAPMGNVIPFRRRRLAVLALAAALAAAALGTGYLIGDRDQEQPAFTAERTVLLEDAGRVARVRIGAEDANGNRAMLVTVEGLRRLPRKDYYTLFMTKNGKPVATCGTFNVAGTRRTTIKLSVAYDPAGFDGLMVAHYRHIGHQDIPLLRAPL